MYLVNRECICGFNDRKVEDSTPESKTRKSNACIGYETDDIKENYMKRMPTQLMRTRRALMKSFEILKLKSRYEVKKRKQP